MLSNKMTFSLLSLVVLLAFGIVCAVPSAFADGDIPDGGKDFFDIDVTIAAGETMVDVSAEAGFQIATGRDRASRDEVTGPASIITLTFTFSKGTIHLHTPQPDADPSDDEIVLTSSEDAFGVDDIFVEAFDKEKRSLGTLPVADVIAVAVAADTDALTSHSDANNPGRVFLLRIDESQIVDAYTAARGGNFEIYHLSFYVPRAVPKVVGTRRVVDPNFWGIKNLALDHVGLDFPQTDDAAKPKAHAHFNKPSNVYTIDLVDDDEGDPEYSRITSNSAAVRITAEGGDTGTPGSGTPGVVAIRRILDRSGFRPIETGPFDVRIILTEEPKGGFTADLIEVQNGTAGTPVKGLTYKGASTTPAQTAELTFSNINYYNPGTTPAENPTPVAATAEAGFPEATGRDNEYHEYSVTITPNPDVDGNVTISIKQFADNVQPVPNMYVPLTAPQRNATILTGTGATGAAAVKNARLMNETLSVRVKSEGDSKVAAATAAYEVRKKDNTGIFNLNPNLKEIGKGLVIPANGYLVLAAGKTDSDPISGVQNVDAKLSKKLTAAQKLYNVVYDFKLPFPANDLSNFFRNGGSLSLVYADIPAATDSGHDDSKASKDGDTTHADYTGYVGATSTPITAGSVIISEIMWGLDGNSVNAQYIELHNTTATAIGIDSLEWAISVGSAPAPFTAIDTVSNNPAPVAPATSGYWQAPGSDGVSSIEPAAGFFALVDIVSMSRVMPVADGSMASSWAASMRPSANLGGRRVGTPGAANVYDTSAKDAADAQAAADAAAQADADAQKAAASKAPVATASDLRITEIMVASSSGRLPQWIEITNTSVGAVSLEGWMVGIDNDAADADVVASSLSIKLDAVTSLDSGQSVLVVSKTSNRNSGVAARAKGDDNAGALDSNRIVDASSQVKPASMTYSMLSEMSFRISLEPPLPLAGGVTVRGDVVGNLGGGWELPMSEAGRSSIIRREMGKTTDIMGTDAAGWTLASSTGLGGAYVATYYGDKDDMGTPGYDAGGALPVELSKFGAKRDRATGQVVITWETQSELNNAGFYIKRAQQRTSQFVAVNPTMIPGAGTTSEKQSYTYTDTTAQPNIVYYYQIEDVSLDGQRQTLTRAHRLKGHVGAAGKLTTLWGELKDQE